MICASWIGERPHVRADDVAGVGCKLGVGREQLRVLSCATLLGLDEQVEPALQALPCGALLGRRVRERDRDFGQPAFHDRVAEGCLAGEVPVDAPVAHAELAGDVDDGGLGWTVAAQDVL